MSTTGGDDPSEAVDFTKPGTPGQPAAGPASVPPFQPEPPPQHQQNPYAPQQPQLNPYAPLPGQKRRMGAGRIIAIVLASLLALFGLALSAGGGVLAWAHASRDSAGFLTTSTERFSTPTAALTSDGVDVNIEGSNWFADHLGTLRITATPRNGKPLFIGIGTLADVRAWLGPAAHDQVRDLEVEPFSVRYSRQPGTVTPVSAPAAQKFWTARSTGGSTQTLNWQITGGQWAIVVANADGSQGVDFDARLGAKLSWLGPLSVALIVAGIVLFLIGIAIIVLAVRWRRKLPQPGQPLGVNP